LIFCSLAGLSSFSFLLFNNKKDLLLSFTFYFQNANKEDFVFCTAPEFCRNLSLQAILKTLPSGISFTKHFQ
jgi:hypothetical protein